MRPSSSILRALTWRRRTPTAAAEMTMFAAGVKTASERSRQLSASSPALSRASGGAGLSTWRGRISVLTAIGWVFIGKGTAQRNYAGAPGGSHLRDTWRTCNTFGSCSMFPRTPGLSGGCSGFSRFRAIRIEHLKQI